MISSKTIYSIEWRLRAINDLDKIIDYIAQQNPIAAKEFGQELRDKVLPLAQFPNMGRSGRTGLPAGVRELVVHSTYILFYKVSETKLIVEILRLKHTAKHFP